jgi:endo-1,4-beta-xylanase
MRGFRIQGSGFAAALAGSMTTPADEANSSLRHGQASGRSTGPALAHASRRSCHGLALALMLVVPAVPAVRAADAPMSEADILGKADARIEQYRKGDAVLKIVDADGKPVAAGTKVKIEQTRHAFLFGSNIFMLNRYGDPKLNAEYAKRFAALFNYATLPFYWWNYEHQQGRPDYARTDEVLSWCREHGVTCKGHPLAWNWVDPRWLPKDPAGAMQIQLDRIVRELAHFKGRIGYWDVVNEATEYDRPGPRKAAPILTKAIAQAGVPEYVRGAFKAARKADPEAKLVINDYVTGPAYVEKVTSKLVDDDGKPLYDVIGIQCHQHGQVWSAKETWKICERFARFGKPLHFTEATILSGQVGWGLRDRDPNLAWDSTPVGEKRQAEEVARFYTVLFSHPAVEGITWWDFSDRGAWQGAPAGFLRKDMTPKPAYDALMGLIKGKWWTKTEAVAEEGGQARFRGFFGEYRVTLAGGGRALVGAFNLERAGQRPVPPRVIEVHLR